MRRRWAAFFLLSACGLCTSCSICEWEVIRETPSPSGNRIATVAGSDCGATTAFNRQVYIRERILGWDRGFRHDSDRQAIAVRGLPEVRLKWVSEDHLAVDVGEHTCVYKKRDHAGRVKVTFSGLGPGCGLGAPPAAPTPEPPGSATPR